MRRWFNLANLWGLASVGLTLECFTIAGIDDALRHHGVWVWVNLAIWAWLGIATAFMVWRGRRRPATPAEIVQAIESSRRLVRSMASDVDRPEVSRAWDEARKSLLRVPRGSI